MQYPGDPGLNPRRGPSRRILMHVGRFEVPSKRSLGPRPLATGAYDRRFGFLPAFCAVTDAARHDGSLLPEIITRYNTGSEAWGDTAYRSRANETFLKTCLQNHTQKNQYREEYFRPAQPGKVQSGKPNPAHQTEEKLGLLIGQAIHKIRILNIKI